MTHYDFVKSNDLVVIRRPSGELGLTHKDGKFLLLNRDAAQDWSNWSQSGTAPSFDTDTHKKLLDGSFVLPSPASTVLQAGHLDDVRIDFQRDGLRWYEESSDLTIIFDPRTTASPHWIALGPHASHCWRNIVRGQTAGMVREASMRLFGYDNVEEALSYFFLKDFIRGIPGLRADGGSRNAFEIGAAELDIQFRIFHSVLPWHCLWEITTACDFACKTCYLQGPPINMSANEIAEICRQIEELRPLAVTLMGGEPLVRSDLENVIERLSSANIFVKVITNGSSLTRERAASLAQAGLRQVEISVDGFMAATHEAVRGQGSFAIAERAIETAINSDIPRTGIVTTVHSGNIHEIVGLPQFLVNHGLSEGFISIFEKTGHAGSDAPWDTLTSQQVRELHGRIEEWRQSYPEVEITLLPGCTCGRTSMVITASGGVRLCPFEGSSIGSLRTESLRGLWEGMGLSLPSDGPLGRCTSRSPRQAQMSTTSGAHYQ